jgi:hypothetical protein
VNCCVFYLAIALSQRQCGVDFSQEKYACFVKNIYSKTA